MTAASLGLSLKHLPPHLDHATRFASLGFRVEESPSLRQDVANHLGEGDVYTVEVDGAPSGFAIFHRYPGHVLYLCGIMLVPDVQGRGLCERIIRGVLTPEDRFLGLRTQSPIMWAAGRRVCRDGWLPRQTDVRDPELLRVGQEVSARIDTSFPFHPGRYGSALYGVKPVHRDPGVQAWWDQHCDFARGDAVVCVGRL